MELSLIRLINYSIIFVLLIILFLMFYLGDIIVHYGVLRILRHPVTGYRIKKLREKRWMLFSKVNNCLETCMILSRISPYLGKSGFDEKYYMECKERNCRKYIREIDRINREIEELEKVLGR